MAGATVEFDDREVRAAIERAVQAMGDPSPMFRSMGEYLLIAHDRHFADQKSPAGVTWRALSPRYQAHKKKNKDRVLILDGYLLNTLRYQVSSTELLFGSNRVYAAAQHFGYPRRKLPARPFLGTSTEDNQELSLIARDYLVRALNQRSP